MTREHGIKSGSIEQKQDGPRRVAFLALGSMGDCLPLLALAASLANSDVPSVTTTAVVTHACHCNLLQGEQGVIERSWIDESINMWGESASYFEKACS